MNNDIKEGISLFTAVKNRAESLEEALQTWITHKQIDEIIIVDWDSNESMIPLVEKYQNGKIFLAVVQDQPRWILSLAFNLAARLTRHSIILKIDADTKILPGFFEHHWLTPGIFYCGNWRLARNENEAHLNGNLFLYRQDFFKVNGYNEFIKTYGWDDSDLFDRLESSGLIRKDLDPDHLNHIEHDERMKNQKPPEFHDLSDAEWARQNIFINRFLANKMEKWSSLCQMMPFRIKEMGDQTSICYQDGADTNTVSSELLSEAEKIAMLDRIAEAGFVLPVELTNLLTKEDISELFLFLISGNTKSINLVAALIKKINETMSLMSPELKKNLERLNEEIKKRTDTFT